MSGITASGVRELRTHADLILKRLRDRLHPAQRLAAEFVCRDPRLNFPTSHEALEGLDQVKRKHVLDLLAQDAGFEDWRDLVAAPARHAAPPKGMTYRECLARYRSIFQAHMDPDEQESVIMRMKEWVNGAEEELYGIHWEAEELLASLETRGFSEEEVPPLVRYLGGDLGISSLFPRLAGLQQVIESDMKHDVAYFFEECRSCVMGDNTPPSGFGCLRGFVQRWAGALRADRAAGWVRGLPAESGVLAQFESKDGVQEFIETLRGRGLPSCARMLVTLVKKVDHFLAENRGIAQDLGSSLDEMFLALGKLDEVTRSLVRSVVTTPDAMHSFLTHVRADEEKRLVLASLTEHNAYLAFNAPGRPLYDFEVEEVQGWLASRGEPHELTSEKYAGYIRFIMGTLDPGPFLQLVKHQGIEQSVPGLKDHVIGLLQRSERYEDRAMAIEMLAGA